VARNLCRVVGRLGSSGHVPQLVAMLGSTDVGVRMAAAQALGHVPGEHEGVGALAFALADEEATVRSAAARSLGQLRAPQAVQSLLSATSDPSAMVRAAAVQALVATDNPVALPRYREVVAEDPVPAVVVQAIAGLGRSGFEHDLGMLMSLCMSADHEVVKAAARALRGYPAHRATAALLGLASHDRWDVRWAAADVLATRGDATALVPLRRFLEQEPDDLVRQVLADAIARLESASESGSAP
jgi:HEAT repeat protein